MYASENIEMVHLQCNVRDDETACGEHDKSCTRNLKDVRCRDCRESGQFKDAQHEPTALELIEGGGVRIDWVVDRGGDQWMVSGDSDGIKISVRQPGTDLVLTLLDIDCPREVSRLASLIAALE